MSNLVQLVSRWEEYAAQSKSPTVEEFAVWMITHSDSALQEKTKGAVNLDSDRFKRDSESRQYAAQAGYLIARLSRFARMYGKPIVQRYNLNSMDDFGFLATIDRFKSIGKKEVCDRSLTEFTTGIDIIKRLKKLSYIKENINQKDKRERLLSLTEPGKKALYAMLNDFRELPDILVDMPVKDRKVIVEWLKKLDLYHSKTYKSILGDDSLK
jgi:DNA-binding MarR family transcriptional regulator